MTAGFLLIVVLHLLNPDALIARTNMARARSGHTLDARYIGHLSADAVPEIMAGISGLNSEDRCTLATYLLRRWSLASNTNE